MSPADVHALAARLYEQVSPQLAVHNLCQAHALLALGVAAGAGVRADFVVRQSDHHAFVLFADGSISENYFRNVRHVSAHA